MASILLDRVVKTYPATRPGIEPRPTIPGLDLEIRDGEFMIFVGPSGCGKSTALRLVAGLEEVTDGSIAFDGRDVTRLSARQRNVAFVFQDYALYPHLTVAGNIGFPLRMQGLAKDEIARRVQATASLLRLTKELGSRPKHLSGGQRQRVAMGRAIVRDPDAFLMDEPLSNLDAMLRVEMRSEICSLQRELGRTMLYVTHDGEEAMTMGDRVAVFREGVLQQCDTPAALYAAPANAFVAGFVGSPQMNFVAGKIWRGEGGWQAAFGPVTLTLPGDVVDRHPGLVRSEGETVIIGFRPETVRIDPSGEDYEALAIVVDSVQQLGRETRILFPAPDAGVGVGEVEDLDHITNKVGRAGQLMVSLSPPIDARPGEKLRLVIDPRALHFFSRGGVAL